MMQLASVSDVLRFTWVPLLLAPSRSLKQSTSCEFSRNQSETFHKSYDLSQLRLRVFHGQPNGISVAADVATICIFPESRARLQKSGSALSFDNN
jgi:hypothetical protein